MRSPGLVACLLLAACTEAADAQTLANRLDRGPDGKVSITYAARADVCGSATLLRIGGALWFGESQWSYTRTDGPTDGSCERRPARVLVTRSEGRVVSVRVGVDGAELPPGTTDLGPVPAADAARAFLDLATSLDGRAGREALLAAVLADSAATWRGLLVIARNPEVSRGLRESAGAWLGRELGAADAGTGSEIGRGLAAIARDPEMPLSVRTRAVSSLARAPGRPAPELVELAGSDQPALAKAALAGLGRSDDPAARTVLRRAAANRELPTAVRVQAIKSLGDRDASPSDIAALRDLWPSLESGERSAVLEVVSGTGGGENARWLLTLVRRDDEPARDRARAVRAAERAGIGSDELVRLYDQVTDREVRQAVIEALGRIGDRTSLAKIQSIAKADTDPTLRRAALRRLAANGGDEARAVIEDIVERP